MIPDPDAKEVLGETIVHINNRFPQVKKYIDEIENSSIMALIEKSFSLNGNKPALGYRKATETDYENKYTFWVVFCKVLLLRSDKN